MGVRPGEMCVRWPSSDSGSSEPNGATTQVARQDGRHFYTEGGGGALQGMQDLQALPPTSTAAHTDVIAEAIVTVAVSELRVPQENVNCFRDALCTVFPVHNPVARGKTGCLMDDMNHVHQAMPHAP